MLSKSDKEHLRIDLISEGTEVHGDIRIYSHLRVEGKIFGNITTLPGSGEETEVYVAPRAVVFGDIAAHRVIIEGSVRGDVKGVVSVDLFSPGRLEGGVTTPRFAVQPGGVFIGESKLPADVEGISHERSRRKGDEKSGRVYRSA